MSPQLRNPKSIALGSQRLAGRCSSVASSAQHRPGLPFLSLSWGALNAQPLHFVESVGGQCVPAKTAQLRSDDRQSRIQKDEEERVEGGSRERHRHKEGGPRRSVT